MPARGAGGPAADESAPKSTGRLTILTSGCPLTVSTMVKSRLYDFKTSLEGYFCVQLIGSGGRPSVLKRPWAHANWMRAAPPTPACEAAAAPPVHAFIRMMIARIKIATAQPQKYCDWAVHAIRRFCSDDLLCFALNWRRQHRGRAQAEVASTHALCSTSFSC